MDADTVTRAPYGTYALDEADRARLRRLLDVDLDPYGDFESFLAAVRNARPAVPAGLRERIAAIGAGRGQGALLITGVPLPENLAATPTRPFFELPPFPVGTEPVLAAMASELGEPFSYREWDRGYLVHNKYPIREHRTIQFGSNAVEFLLHTETPFREPSPDFLLLLCLRGDPGGTAKTRLADLVGAVASLPSEQQDVLRESSFAFVTDNPVVVVDGRGLTRPSPIVGTVDGRRRLQYVDDLVGLGPAAESALAALRSAIAAGAHDVGLNGGDLLILDNRRVVHGRNAFEPRYDGQDRWLQRMLVSTSFSPSGEDWTERLVADQRFANYPSDYQQVLRGDEPARN